MASVVGTENVMVESARPVLKNLDSLEAVSFFESKVSTLLGSKRRIGRDLSDGLAGLLGGAGGYDGLIADSVQVSAKVSAIFEMD